MKKNGFMVGNAVRRRTFSTTTSAQWSNTTNLLYDSLDMAACNAPVGQGASLLVRSYPDSGYFVIWTDARSGTNVIYAQKYYKAGNRLWAVNGVPVTASANSDQYTYQGQNYRRRSYAATDGAGGFYITYADDSSSSYRYERVCLDNLNAGNYQPPYNRLRAFPNPYGPVIDSLPLFGTTNAFSTVEVQAPYGVVGVSPTVAITDNYNLGNVAVRTYDNTSGIRNTGGVVYMDRSWIIRPDRNPNGAAGWDILRRCLHCSGRSDNN